MTSANFKAMPSVRDDDPKTYIAKLIEMPCEVLVQQYFVVGRLMDKYRNDQRENERLQAHIWLNAIAAIGRALFDKKFDEMLVANSGK